MTAAQVKATLGSGVPIDLGPAAISIHCERRVETKTVGGQQYKWLGAATISIRTASDPYQLFFPEETEPPLPEKLAQRIENDFALVKRMLPPIGAIIGFVLTPQEVARLAPEWLPADGREVADPQSPLDKRKLPDMNGRLLRGVPPDQDASDNASMTGGSLHVSQGIQLAGATGELQHTRCSPWDHEARNFFPNQQGDVWDSVNVDEQACQHTHILGGANLTMDLPEPPHRGVIFLVRVR
jgi:hypothetical protein